MASNDKYPLGSRVIKVLTEDGVCEVTLTASKGFVFAYVRPERGADDVTVSLRVEKLGNAKARK